MKNTKLLIIIVAAIVLIGGGAAVYFLSQDSENTGGGGILSGLVGVDPSKEFKPAELDKLSFVETTTSSFSDEESISVMESDGKGLTKSTTDMSTGTLTIYMDINNKKVYSCMGSEPCEVRDAMSEEEIPDFTEDESDVKKEYQGKADCSAGSCHKWQITSRDTVLLYYLDSDNRVSDMEIGSANSDSDYTTKISYEYKPVSITLPQV